MTGQVQREKIGWKNWGSGTYVTNSLLTAESFNRTKFFSNGSTTIVYINYLFTTTKASDFTLVGYIPYNVGSWGALCCGALQDTTGTATI